MPSAPATLYQRTHQAAEVRHMTAGQPSSQISQKATHGGRFHRVSKTSAVLPLLLGTTQVSSPFLILLPDSEATVRLDWIHTYYLHPTRALVEKSARPKTTCARLFVSPQRLEREPSAYQAPQQQPGTHTHGSAGTHFMASAHGPGQAGITADLSPQDSSSTVYNPLKTPSSIRLLRLHRIEAGSGIRAELAAFDIADGETCPPFTTVSYTWGAGHSDQHIRINGQDRTVLKSLLPLLRMLCSDENRDFDLAERWFWVDSICIDQADTRERAAQVKLMTSIYRKAQSTLVWLAEGSEDTQRAIDFLRILQEKRRDLRQAVKKRVKRVPDDLQGHPGWGSLERLLQRPWWRRVWTLQEFIIPERLRFYCGPNSISRSSFRQGMGALELCGPLNKYIQEQAWTTAWNRRRIVEWYQDEHHRNRIPLVSLLASCGDHYASDDQDRIWALHGLARPEDREMIGPPTYQDNVETLYARLVKNFVDTYRSLDIICYAQIFTGHRHGPDPIQWPSWVPDWRVEIAHPPVVPLMVSQSASLPLANLRPPKPHRHPALLRNSKKKPAGSSLAYRASGGRSGKEKSSAAGRPLRVTFSEDLTHLTCQGIRLDVIDGLGTSQGDYRIAAQCTSPVNTTAVSAEVGGDDVTRKSALYSVARSLVLDRQDQFLETRAPARQYLRELKLLALKCCSNSPTNSTIPLADNIHADHESRINNSNSSAESDQDQDQDQDDDDDDDDDNNNNNNNNNKDSSSYSPPPSPTMSHNYPATHSVPAWFEGWWKDNNHPHLRIRGFTLSELCQADEPGFDPTQGTRRMSKSFYARFRGTMKAAPRRLMVLREGVVGMAPRRARKGDWVCVLLGCSVPVVLRPYPATTTTKAGGHDHNNNNDDDDDDDDTTGASSSPRTGMYEFVGECYVDGFMDGEVLDLGRDVEHFTLR